MSDSCQDHQYPAFLTGSRAYGTPREDSDIDLVIGTDAETIKMLFDESDQKPKCTFGRINLIAFDISSERGRFQYSQWKRVNDILVKSKPVTRDKAVEAFQEAGLDYPEADERDVNITEAVEFVRCQQLDDWIFE